MLKTEKPKSKFTFNRQTVARLLSYNVQRDAYVGTGDCSGPPCADCQVSKS